MEGSIVEPAIREITFAMVCPSEEKRSVTIRIGVPYELDEDAACPITMEGLYSRLSDIRGVDTFQAVALACRFVQRTLQLWMEKGYAFRYPGTDTILVPDDAWVRQFESDAQNECALRQARRNTQEQIDGNR